MVLECAEIPLLRQHSILADVERATSMFAMDYFREEGLLDHSVHTAVIDRKGKLAAKIEGNRFTAEQLADLVLSKHARE